MKYYLVLSPKSFQRALALESKRLLKLVYKKDVENLYYRVQTKQILDNRRRLFVKGDGRIIETLVKPHVSLVHNIELKNVQEFANSIERICNLYKPIHLDYNGVGNYDMDFTFFVRFSTIPELVSLRNKLLEASKLYMTKEEYNQHREAKFIPHASVLYDDIDSEKVRKAYRFLDVSKFHSGIDVTEVILWRVTWADQVVVNSFKLSR